MFGFVDTGDVDAEKGIGDVAVGKAGGVGEEEVDEEAAEGKGNAEPKVAEAGVDFMWGDDVVVVTVPKCNVLLEGSGRFEVVDLGWEFVGCVGLTLVVIVDGELRRDLMLGAVIRSACGGNQIRIFEFTRLRAVCFA